MKCNIEYVGKSRNGTLKYYCITHKAVASDIKGNKLDECLCTYKEMFNNRLKIKEMHIESIKIIYEDILKNVVPKVVINGKEFLGILEYDNCLLSYKDFGGTMLSKLNNVYLDKVVCKRCNHFHSDNGRFAYTPHLIHLCLYCGHLIRAKEKNIGNEFNIIYNIPNIELSDGEVYVNDYCRIEYDLLTGEFLVNNRNVDKVIFNAKEISIVEFLNNVLEGEF